MNKIELEHSSLLNKLEQSQRTQDVMKNFTLEDVNYKNIMIE